MGHGVWHTRLVSIGDWEEMFNKSKHSLKKGNTLVYFLINLVLSFVGEFRLTNFKKFIAHRRRYLI